MPSIVRDTIWSMAESPYEVSKAVTVANMVSGRYVTDHRARHWSSKNSEGICQLSQIFGFPSVPGSLEHQLLSCQALTEVRSQSVSLWSSYMVDKPMLLPIISAHTLSPGPEGVKLHMQLLLDPTASPLVISAVQAHGKSILIHLLYLARTWCHANHVRRRRLLRLYNII